MKKKIIISSAAALCLLLTSAGAKESFSAQPLPLRSARRYVLDNGMTLILEQMTTSETLSLILLVNSGSATEGDFLGSGISHFIEHMLFKGTEKRPPGEIFREIESLGGRINAFTSYDYTGYTITLPKAELRKGVEILADALMNAQFDPEEMEKEREVILAEIRLNRDNPDRQIFQLLFSAAFLEHPYRHPIIGYEPLFLNLTREDLLEYYQKKYVPNNIILALAGNIDIEEAHALIKNEFQEFKMRPFPQEPGLKEAPQISRRQIEEEYPTDLARMFLGFRGVPILNSDLFAMDVLALILGQGQSSRLYKEIYRNKGLVHFINASNYTLRQEGLFAIRCMLEPEKTQEAINAILEEINNLKKGRIRPAELKRARNQLLSSYIFSRQTPAGIARDLALNEALTGDFDFSQKYLEGIKRVGAQDIRRVAEKYLQEESLTVAILNPLITAPETEAEEAKSEEPQIKMFVLDNGLTVLLREDKSLPIVSLRALFLGGLRAEKEEDNGISNLVSRMLLRGTRQRSAVALAEEIESLGASISAFSGNNSFGFSLDLLSQDFEKGLEILIDIISNSTFPEEELAREKELALSQIRAEQDNIFQLAFKSLRQAVFKKHPYRLNELGTEESIKKISRRQTIEFWQKYSRPNNLVLTLFGDINSEDALRLVKNNFAKFTPAKIEFDLPEDSFFDPPQELLIQAPKEQALIMLGFAGVKLTDSRRYPLEVLDSILTSSSGRLFQRIREELGQAYTLGGGSMPGIERGLYYLYVSTSPENLEEVKAILLQELGNIRLSPVDKEELSGAKSYLIGTQIMRLETNSALAFQSGLDELYGLGHADYKLYAEAISGVTKEDILALAQSYLSPDKMAVVIIRQ